MTAELNFLYDQVLEGFSRLDCFSSSRKGYDEFERDGTDDVDEDIEHITGLLARRDLLVFAASLRNFAESTKSISLMKEQSLNLSEPYISNGPPFFRESKRKLNLHQAVSRILHSHQTDVLHDPFGFVSATFDGDDPVGLYNKLVAEKPNFPARILPMITTRTEKEGVSFFALSSLINAAKNYTELEMDALSHERTFIQRSLRDV
jgi:hypothetical protein